LTIMKSHTGNFIQGQAGAVYTITANNVGTGPTSGTITVIDTLPVGLTATGMTGTGWSCALATLACTRSDALASGASYPAITATTRFHLEGAARPAQSQSTSRSRLRVGGSSVLHIMDQTDLPPCTRSLARTARQPRSAPLVSPGWVPSTSAPPAFFTARAS